MLYYSTLDPQQKVTLQEAVVNGLAPGGGLYMPEEIPGLPASFYAALDKLSFQEIGMAVVKPFVDADVSGESLQQIIAATLQFDAPVVKVEESVFALELFHGPTLAFKDFGARFLSQLLGHFANQSGREIVILVATSGDTGSAVAHGFYGVPGTRVFVLYPSGKVSPAQEKQFATLGKNITALEVEGTFDDCQRMVKEAFGNAPLRDRYFLTSANSINIARLLPQMFYYFRAYAQLSYRKQPLVVSVPSGNFGNLTAGLLAQRMGLPITHFVASTNVNDVVPEYLTTNQFRPRPSIQTISNAMDVGNPSNFYRLLDLFHGDRDALSKQVSGVAFDDHATRNVMKQVYDQSGYIMDPHGAVGYLGLKQVMNRFPNATGLFLETAHPAKFKEPVEDAIGKELELPAPLAELMSKSTQSIKIKSRLEELSEVMKSTLD